MDLLRDVYSSRSDEEGEAMTVEPDSKRIRFDNHPGYRRTIMPRPSETLSTEGRYISKRERARLKAEASASSAVSVLDSPVSASVAAPALLKGDSKNDTNTNMSTIMLMGHVKAVNAVEWSPSHAHLLASAGMDQTVRLWNLRNKENPAAKIFTHHTGAVKDLRWSPKALTLLSCGFDQCSRMIDLEKGMEKHVFKEDQAVGCVKFHPENPNLFLAGGLRGSLRLWDIRKENVAQVYVKKSLGAILDVDFSPDGRHFVSSSDVSQTNASDNAIIVWDVARQISLSNQIYIEAYTCPSVQYHPREACFVAQSNGNYVAIFSARSPFKLDRYRRLEGGHSVSGFPVRFDFSIYGDTLASGSADGSIYFYGFHSSKLLLKRDTFKDACIDVALHPSSDAGYADLVAACSWDGQVAVFHFPRLERGCDKKIGRWDGQRN